MFSDAEKTKKRMFSCTRDGKKIFCEMVTPAGNGPFPLVVWVHPFGDNSHVIDHTEAAQHGIAVCAFDFCGGAPDSRSDGASTDMSVVTEAADLQTVLKKMMELPEVDPDRIYLMGMSQGGYVAAMIAGLGTIKIAGMLLLCPAFVLEDLREHMFGRREIPDRFRVRNMNLGSRYVRDLEQIRIYELMPEYPGPVLIWHGDKDELVPASYIERALEKFPNARLVTVEGAGHDDLPVKREEMLLDSLVRFVQGSCNGDPAGTGEGCGTDGKGGAGMSAAEDTHAHEHTHTDENGNTWTHSHDHDHSHSADHDHTHGHAHEHTHTDENGNTWTHSHDHDHSGDHQHPHEQEQTREGSPADDSARAMAMMKYMYHHNESHLTELTDTVGMLHNSGKTVQAIKLEGAAELFRLANRVLQEVLTDLQDPGQ